MTDKEAVLRWLRTHGSIEPLTALREIGTFRLGARIWDLRHTTIFETDNTPSEAWSHDVGGSQIVTKSIVHSKPEAKPPEKKLRGTGP